MFIQIAMLGLTQSRNHVKENLDKGISVDNTIHGRHQHQQTATKILAHEVCTSKSPESIT